MNSFMISSRSASSTASRSRSTSRSSRTCASSRAADERRRHPDREVDRRLRVPLDGQEVPEHRPAGGDGDPLAGGEGPPRGALRERRELGRVRTAAPLDAPPTGQTALFNAWEDAVECAKCGGRMVRTGSCYRAATAGQTRAAHNAVNSGRAASMSVSLCAVQVENLRGFRSANLNVEQDIVLLIRAPTITARRPSFVYSTRVLIPADDAVLTGGRGLSGRRVRPLLIPARDTRGGARRLTLLVRIADGRRHTRFNATGGIARLEFRFRNDRIYVNIRTPTGLSPSDTNRGR